jgi:carbon-monoxide dehydrogenase medium subunit
MRDAAGCIGSHPIRIRGTVGGSLAHADATAEWPLLALAMDAVLLVRGPTGDRELPASEFFLGRLTTGLEPEDLITAVRFGRAAAHTRLEQYARRAADFAIVAAAVSVVIEDNRCTSARIVLGGVAGTPIRIGAAERMMAGVPVDDPDDVDALIREVAHTCSTAISPRADERGSERYRRRLAETLTGRSLRHSLRHCLDPGGADR